MSRGYGEVQVQRQMKEGFMMTRDEALRRVEKKRDNRINFVTTHSSYLPNINKILKRHRHYLKEDGLDKYVEDVPRLSLRKGKNLSDLVVNAKEKNQDGGSGPCGKGCKLCKYMVEGQDEKDKEPDGLKNSGGGVWDVV